MYVHPYREKHRGTHVHAHIFKWKWTLHIPDVTLEETSTLKRKLKHDWFIFFSLKAKAFHLQVHEKFGWVSSSYQKRVLETAMHKVQRETKAHRACLVSFWILFSLVPKRAFFTCAWVHLLCMDEASAITGVWGMASGIPDWHICSQSTGERNRHAWK